MSRSTSLLLAALVLGTPLAATDGYFSHGYGTASKAMAGATTALPHCSLSVSMNPAAAGFLGSQVNLGLAWFAPNRDYTVTGNPSMMPGTFGLAPGKVESGSKGFLVPSLGVTWKGGASWTLGVAVYGNGGMNTDYDAPTFGQKKTGVNLEQLFVSTTLGYRLDERHAVGAAVVLAHQSFKAEGLGAFGMMGFSADPANLTNNGTDTSMGAAFRVGYLGRLTQKFSLGASYQTRTKMGRFSKYAGLFAEGGSFDIPSTWNVGVAYRPIKGLILALDQKHIGYSEVKAIANPMLPNLMAAKLGQAGGAGFGWKDVDVTKLGLEWKATPEWILRAGYSVGSQPIPDSEVMFNILAPGVIERQATCGFTYLFEDGRTLGFSASRALSQEVSGANPLEVPGQQRISLRMDQWEFEFGYGFRF